MGMKKTNAYNSAKIREIVNKHYAKTDKPNREKIKASIEKYLSGVKPKVSFIWAVHEYLEFAINNFDPNRSDMFYKVFYDDLKSKSNDPEFWIPYYTLRIEGITDMLLMDTTTEQIREGYPEIHPGFSKIWMERISTRSKHNKLPVLIEGATGTSKESLAKAIHKLSGREGDIVEINCAAIPEPLKMELYFLTKLESPLKTFKLYY
jgi:hypothetical protein